MKKTVLFFLTIILLYSCFSERKGSRSERKRERREEENEKYDNPWARGLEEAEKIKDPALGYVPYQRLFDAIQQTEYLKNNAVNRTYLPLTWEERGPIYDSVGPSNGNGRGGGTGSTAGGHTSGRIRAFLLDTLNDATGNTAFCGGVDGGIWRCTNFLSAIPNWTPINDYFSNLSISSICQNPTNPSIIYFSSGEPTSNADAVYGKGVWKSTNGGLTFNFLPSTSNFLRNYKVGCDAAGNVYLASRITTIPIAQSNGLFRSVDGGTTWVNITPNDLTANNNTCTDFEITASGKLNATFGYLAGNTLVNQRYTTDPVNVTPSTWSAGSGFRTTAGAIRTEMAVMGEVLYAITVNTAYNTDSCYKSVDGGTTWTKQNTTALPGGLGNGQGWYSLSVAINPTNTNELISGGLDAFRSVNSGANWTKFTNWVSTMPYVHADHHYAQYWISGAETRMIMCTDGGVFYSNNNGATFTAKNRNLAIKQFYSAAIHPAAGSPYLIAGAQDNGVHQLKNPGLSYSWEVTGGDGCIVHINQQNPLIQFGSYVYNQYRRTTNGGNTWSSVNLSSSQGLFVNPFDYDDALNIMYCSNGPTGQLRRWINANTSSTNTTMSIAAVGGTISLTAFKVSPYTANRVFMGTSNGKVFRLDNANSVTAATIDANTTAIGSASIPAGNVSCINTGTDDNNLVLVLSNYGVSNVWITTDGGTSWTAIDGNLPDMPVRWALFEPGTNEKIYLATEAGIYTTTAINGASTQWLPENGFPTVRTDMLKMRASDSTIVAGTHGRGLFTAKIPPCNVASLTSQPNNAAVCAGSNASFTVGTSGAGVTYQWQFSTDGGATWNNVPGGNAAILNLPAVTGSMNGYQYKCIVDTYCSGLLTTNTVTLTVNTPATVTCPANITVSNTPGLCGANVTYPAAITTGSPAPAVSYSIPSGSFFPKGTTTVFVTSTNVCATANCSFTVTVNDTQAPTITCPANITVSNATNQCGANVNFLVNAADNCPFPGSSPLTVTQSSSQSLVVGSVACNAGGLHTDNSYWRAIDLAPLALSGPFQINQVSFGVEQAIGATGSQPVTVRIHTSAGPFPASPRTLVAQQTFTVPNMNGAIFTGTFTTPPSVPANAMLIIEIFTPNGQAVGNSFFIGSNAAPETGFSYISAADCGAPNPVTLGSLGFPNMHIVMNAIGIVSNPQSSIVTTPASGSFFPVGTTTVNSTVTDASGNTTSCSFTVRVNDTQVPTITCPGNITVTTAIGSCTSIVPYTVTSSDNCPSVTQALQNGLASNAVYPIGVTTNTWRATDAAGNISTCTFTVTVRDGQLPVIGAQPVNITSCVGSNTAFSVTSTNGVSYQWQQWNGTAWVNIAGATANTLPLNSVTLAMNTNTYRVNVVGLCTTVTSAPASLYVNALPTITLTTTKATLTPGETTSITAVVKPTSGTITWTYNGNAIPGGFTLSGLGIDNIGTYKATYTDLNGCKMTSNDLVINALSTNNLYVMPNPNNGQFQVRFYATTSSTPLTVTVFNSGGSKVYERHLTSAIPYAGVDVDLGEHAGGTYVVEIRGTDGKRVASKKVVVRAR